MTTIEIEPGTIRRVDELEKLFDDSDDAFCHLCFYDGRVEQQSCCGLRPAPTCPGKNAPRMWNGETVCVDCGRPICPDCTARTR